MTAGTSPIAIVPSPHARKSRRITNCEFFASRLPAVLEQLGDVPARLVKVNAYEHDSLATRFGLYGIPQFFLYRDGKRIGKMSEFRGDAFFLGVLRDQLPAAG